MNVSWRLFRARDRRWFDGGTADAGRPGARLARVLADDRTRERAEIVLVVLMFILALLIVGRVNGQPVDAPERGVRLSDEAVKVYVDAELIGDEGVNAYQIMTNVVGGVVTLMGRVDTPLAKARAVAAAQRARGVVRVEDQLGIRERPAGVDDSAVRHSVKAALLRASRSWAGRPSRAEVSSTDGRVVLTGCSDSYAQKMMTGRLVASLPGVMEVDNLLGVQPFVTRTDGELAAEIRRGLEQSGALIGEAVVTVKDGYVSLDGAVPTEEHKLLAERVAWVPGVLGVNLDRLEVMQKEVPGGAAPVDSFTMRDLLLRDRILRAWRADSRVGPSNIYVRVDGDVAILTGRADTLETKRAAEELAMTSLGIRDVVNEMTVVQPADLPGDGRIASELARDIRLSPYLDNRMIDVEVVERTAILNGRVDTAEQRRWAGVLAERRPGVSRVVNNLRVGRWRPMNDREIQGAVQEAMFWGPGISGGRGEIDARALNGAVTLTGRAVAPEVARAAVDRAYKSGAQKVINKIRISDAVVPGD